MVKGVVYGDARARWRVTRVRMLSEDVNKMADSVAVLLLLLHALLSLWTPLKYSKRPRSSRIAVKIKF